MRRHSNRAMIQCAKLPSAIENERSRPSLPGQPHSVICPLICLAQRLFESAARDYVADASRMLWIVASIVAVKSSSDC